MSPPLVHIRLYGGNVGSSFGVSWESEQPLPLTISPDGVFAHSSIGSNTPSLSESHCSPHEPSTVSPPPPSPPLAQAAATIAMARCPIRIFLIEPCILADRDQQDVIRAGRTVTISRD